MKTCSICKIDKELDFFYKSPNNKYYHSRCNPCVKKYQKSDAHKTSARNWVLKTIYKITPEKYNEMYISQDGRCAICKKHQNELSYKLSVDHNHKTNNIRGLLCKPCNLLVGNTRDNISILDKAKFYLIDFDGGVQ